MDTSEQYIKMCEGAEEIQSNQHNERDWLGNIYFGNLDIEPVEQKPHLFSNNFSEVTPSTVWLPRQDQLQEMVADNSLERPWVHLCYQFYKWAHLNWNDFASMEQLWLAFIMKENYKKTWDGEEWE